jgi:hypothetical protein
MAANIAHRTVIEQRAIAMLDDDGNASSGIRRRLSALAAHSSECSVIITAQSSYPPGGLDELRHRGMGGARAERRCAGNLGVHAEPAAGVPVDRVLLPGEGSSAPASQLPRRRSAPMHGAAVHPWAGLLTLLALG